MCLFCASCQSFIVQVLRGHGWTTLRLCSGEVCILCWRQKHESIKCYQEWPVPQRKVRQSDRMEKEVRFRKEGSFSYCYPNKSHVLTFKVVAKRSKWNCAIYPASARKRKPLAFLSWIDPPRFLTVVSGPPLSYLSNDLHHSGTLLELLQSVIELILVMSLEQCLAGSKSSNVSSNCIIM